MKKYLVLGDGLLAKEIIKQTNWDYISRKKDNFDIEKSENFEKFLTEKKFLKKIKKYDTIINCIANTNTYTTEKKLHWNVNYKAVYNLAKFCNKYDIKLVHISTDYLFANCKIENPNEDDVPVHAENHYSYTKLLGDAIVQLISKKYLICRCTHKPYPFPFDAVFIDRIGNFDYTPKISELIIKLVKNEAEGVFNVGTSKKTMLELVINDNPNIKKIKTPKNLPKKTTMNIEKLKNFLYIK